MALLLRYPLLVRGNEFTVDPAERFLGAKMMNLIPEVTALADDFVVKLDIDALRHQNSVADADGVDDIVLASGLSAHIHGGANISAVNSDFEQTAPTGNLNLVGIPAVAAIERIRRNGCGTGHGCDDRRDR